jgi:Protein of unknown function (DUF2958)
MIELQSMHGKLGLPVERDRHFEADKTISDDADEARARGHIVTSSSRQAVRASMPSPGTGESGARARLALRILGRSALASVATSV